MDECVSKLIALLKPTITDLDERKEELSSKSETLDEVSKMLEEVNEDVKKVSKYKNQNLILDNLGMINTTEREYRACCYLLNCDEKNVCSLPQYIESVNYIERLINYFKKMKEELILEVSELKVVYTDKSLNKKYFEIFSTDNPFVYDAKEFRELLDKQMLTDEDKVNLLVYTIKNNINNYLKDRKS